MSEEIIHDGKYIQLVKNGTWEYVKRKGSGDAVVIVPVDGDQVILLSEYRVPLGGRELGFPAGLVEDDEDIFASARREMVEETGMLPNSLKLLTHNSPSSSGLTNETFHLLLAEDLVKVGEGGGDESEDIRVVRAPLKHFRSFIKAFKECSHISPKIYMGMYFMGEYGYEVS